jgi:uncharacterized membrane protein
VVSDDGDGPIKDVARPRGAVQGAWNHDAAMRACAARCLAAGGQIRYDPAVQEQPHDSPLMKHDRSDNGDQPDGDRDGPLSPHIGVPHPDGGGSVMGRLRNYFLAGLVVIAPVSITLWLTWEFVSFVDATLTPLLPPPWRPRTYLPFDIPGLGLIIAGVGLVAIGVLATGLIGRLIMREAERLVDRLPVIRSVYSAIKQIFETVLAQRSSAFRQAVLVEYPCRGTWAIAFITGTTRGEVQQVTDETVVNVFLPATPNPSTGFLIFVPHRDVIYLDMSVEDAAKLIISGGIITPPERAETQGSGGQAAPGEIAEGDLGTALASQARAARAVEDAAKGRGSRRRRARFALATRLRNYFFAGLLVTAPISITIWLTWNVIALVDSQVTPWLPDRWNPESYLPFSLPGLGVALVLIVLTLVGMFATGVVGRLLMTGYERFLRAVPVVRTVYSATKQIFETVLAHRATAFRKVVLIQYPRPESWALAFITSETLGEVKRKAPDERVNVFMPTTPNPTSGFLLFVPRKEIFELAMTPEEGAKMIISGGIIAPELPAESAPGKAEPADVADLGAVASRGWTGRG